MQGSYPERDSRYRTHSAAAAAVAAVVVIAAAAVVAEEEEEKNQNDDPPEAVALVTAHKKHSLQNTQNVADAPRPDRGALSAEAVCSAS